VFLTLIVLSFFMRLKAQHTSGSESAEPALPAAPMAPSPAPAATIPEVKLIGVDEKSAAMIMAIVCDELQMPPEKLCFKTIRSVDTAE
jgi:hypothetical protein